jgi:hypothetical protein
MGCWRQHVVNRGMRLVQVHGHHHALAGGQSIGLDDDRRALLVDVGVRRGASEKVAKRAVGMLCLAMKRLAKSFELSSCAASLVGPKIFRPRARNRLTIPAASGASGPTTVSGPFALAGEVGEGFRIGEVDVLEFALAQQCRRCRVRRRPSAGQGFSPDARRVRVRDRRNR